MEVVSQVIKMLYRIRFWLIAIPVLTTLYAIQKTSNLERYYEVNTTLYTGIASGYSVESGLESSRTDWFAINNGMDNLISILKSKSTLREVSFRLYTQHMILGDTLKDNNYITAENYRRLLRITPRDVKALIDKTSAEKTIENLKSYEKASPDNFVYGLFNWYHVHYSYSALSKIEVKRVFNSDMLEIKYSANDPGIAYNTLLILNEEIVNQYALLRYGETNNVVDYFKNELEIISKKLRQTEDALTEYYIENKVINYDEQTKIISAQSRDYDLLYNDLLRISNEIGEKRYTKDGIATTVYVDQWIAETINKPKALAELKVMEEVKKGMDAQYVTFSPIGSTLKRMERDIGFLEHSYLSTLQSLNTALMRQK